MLRLAAHPSRGLPRRSTALLLLTLMVSLASCASDNTRLSDPPGDATMGGDLLDPGDATYSDGACVARDDPEGDADGDGLTNALEDRDADCERDADETDPREADTDADGLLDGQEDINRNGRVDGGELDPRLADTDGDGRLDADSPLRLVCTPTLLTDTQAVPVPEAASSLALPLGFTVTRWPALGAAAFDAVDGSAAGFIMAGAPGEALDVVEAGARALALLEVLGAPLTLEARAFATWRLDGDDASLAARPALAQRLSFAYGPGTSNPLPEAQAIGQLRDAALGALSGAPETPDSGLDGERCPDLELSMVSILRADGQVVHAGLLACSATLAHNDALAWLLDDLAGATMIAPLSHTPSAHRCLLERARPAAGDLDLLWVMDNSVSMLDERPQLTRAAQVLADTLLASQLNWRLGVTTTEAHLLDDPDAPPPAHDELLDPCSGLRGPGFFDAPALTRDPTLLVRLVDEDAGCDANALHDLEGAPAPPGANLCGALDEQGLASAVDVLSRALSDACDPTHRLRPDASRLVLWTSDEEDAALRDADGAPLPPHSTARAARAADITADLTALRVVGCAIVGDPGHDAGGLCDPLVAEPPGRGAEHGLAYLAQASATGGASGSVCADDLQATLTTCLARAAGFARRYPLPSFPVVPSIRVAIDGRLVPRSASAGWSYDPEDNALTLHGLALSAESAIAVGYLRWQPGLR